MVVKIFDPKIFRPLVEDFRLEAAKKKVAAMVRKKNKKMQQNKISRSKITAEEEREQAGKSRPIRTISEEQKRKGAAEEQVEKKELSSNQRLF